MERIYITKEDKITASENNLVNLSLKDGESFENLEPRRLFPVNRPDEYITLLDSEGVEKAVVRNISELNAESRVTICRSLDDYYLVPQITKIVSTAEKYGNLHWVVETDRGRKEFDIRNRNSDIRIYSDGRVRVRDSDDNRYVIDDWQVLDKHSKSLLVADM
ncbi:MAG: DUF1854 domain-containing protein [Ruminococcaceae bacterium]|nr:DUF1854 domain-containing protein [Oscillospiraceae bacterium]